METTPEKKPKILYIVLSFLLLVLLAWRLYLFLNGEMAEDYSVQLWAATYQVIAWLGVFSGFYFAKLWGGWKSLVGRANLLFSLGLLAQSLGQTIFSYFFYIGQEVPYPSLADIGFFGSIPFYIYGAALLFKFSYLNTSQIKLKSWLAAILFPLVMLLLSYYFFLQGYDFADSDSIKIFLDFGYPLGQAVYVSLAVLALFAAKRIWGGLMIKPTILFIIALVTQFIADYLFLYLSNQDLYIGWGIDAVDLLYLAAYTLMTFSLIMLGRTFYKIKDS